MDFTLTKYEKILQAALSAGYATYSVSAWHDLPPVKRKGVMLRHDVDRRPEKALAMAQLERRLDVSSTYYFRILPCAFDPGIIKSILALGHEIGYHYEDWHLAGQDPQKAIALFQAHLAKIRELAPVRSIAMHGSPLARQNNMTIWDHAKFEEFGVNDAILSFDYSGYVFFTDSGRTFGVSGANLRDYLGKAETVASVRSSDELAHWLLGHPRDQIQISVHPERWNEKTWPWIRQWGVDTAANAAKRALKMTRGGRS